MFGRCSSLCIQPSTMYPASEEHPRDQATQRGVLTPVAGAVPLRQLARVEQRRAHAGCHQPVGVELGVLAHRGVEGKIAESLLAADAAVIIDEGVDEVGSAPPWTWRWGARCRLGFRRTASPRRRRPRPSGGIVVGARVVVDGTAVVGGGRGASWWWRRRWSSMRPGSKPHARAFPGPPGPRLERPPRECRDQHRGEERTPSAHAAKVALSVRFSAILYHETWSARGRLRAMPPGPPPPELRPATRVQGVGRSPGGPRPPCGFPTRSSAGWPVRRTGAGGAGRRAGRRRGGRWRTSELRLAVLARGRRVEPPDGAEPGDDRGEGDVGDARRDRDLGAECRCHEHRDEKRPSEQEPRSELSQRKPNGRSAQRQPQHRPERLADEGATPANLLAQVVPEAFGSRGVHEPRRERARRCRG